jgi:hypothetical protein
LGLFTINGRRRQVEVRIGIKGAPRELAIETSESAAAVESALRAAVADGGVFTLTDDKGKQVLVPVATLAYIEVGEHERAKVGFTAAG